MTDSNQLSSTERALAALKAAQAPEAEKLQAASQVTDQFETPKQELPTLTPVIKNKYKCTQHSCRYIFKDGKNAAFSDFTYYTDVPTEIEELNYEINVGRNPFFYVIPNELTVDMNTLDPLAEIKRQLKAEAQAEARSELLRDLGVTNNGDDLRSRLQGMSNTITVGQGAAASNTAGQ